MVKNTITVKKQMKEITLYILIVSCLKPNYFIAQNHEIYQLIIFLTGILQFYVSKKRVQQIRGLMEIKMRY